MSNIQTIKHVSYPLGFSSSKAIPPRSLLVAPRSDRSLLRDELWPARILKTSSVGDGDSKLCAITSGTMASEDSAGSRVLGDGDTDGRSQAGMAGDGLGQRTGEGGSMGREGRSTQSSDLDDKLRRLNLREEEEEDAVLEENLDELEKDAELMALARVHTERKFSHGAFYGTMRSAWNSAQSVEFRAMEDNLFSVQLSCLADWEGDE